MKRTCERIGYPPHTTFFTRFVAYPGPSSPGLYQPTAGLNPGLCFLSEQSSLIIPTDPQAIRALVGLESEVTQPMHLLVPVTVH